MQDAKTLLGGQTLAAGQSGLDDIADGLDNLFYHPHTAPFLARLLLQRLAHNVEAEAGDGRGGRVTRNATSSSVLSAFIFGGAILQWPLGKLSDKADRQWVIVGVALVAVMLALVLLVGVRFPGEGLGREKRGA